MIQPKANCPRYNIRRRQIPQLFQYYLIGTTRRGSWSARAHSTILFAVLGEISQIQALQHPQRDFLPIWQSIALIVTNQPNLFTTITVQQFIQLNHVIYSISSFIFYFFY